MTDEIKQLIEDAAKLLGYKLAYSQHSDTPYLADKNGNPTYYIFNPCDPDRGDLMKLAIGAKLSLELDVSLVSADWDGKYTYRINEKIKGSDYQSLCYAILRAASAVWKSRGGV